MTALADRVLIDPATIPLAHNEFTKEGLAAYAAAIDRDPPPDLSRQEYDSLDPTDRGAHDLDRLDWLANLPTVHTETVEDVLDHLHGQFDMNRRSRKPGPRVGTIIDGPPTTGKSTILRRFCAEVINKAPEWDGPDEHIEASLVTLAAGTTVKIFNQLVCRFYAIPYEGRTESWMTDRIIDTANACGTKVFGIDDVHFLDMRYRGAHHVNNHIKRLASEIPATFLMAGVDCDKAQLFSEGMIGNGLGHGQVSGRMAVVNLDRVLRHTDEGADTWGYMVADFADQLRLVDTTPAHVEALEHHLHAVTGGLIGPLAHVLSMAASRIIDQAMRGKRTDELMTTDDIDAVLIPRVRTAPTGGHGGKGSRRRT